MGFQKKGQRFLFKAIFLHAILIPLIYRLYYGGSNSLDNLISANAEF